MTQTVASDLNALPVSDRLKLIEDLWDPIEAEVSDKLPLPDWHRNEIDRRPRSLDDGTSVGVPWTEVRRRIVGES